MKVYKYLLLALALFSLGACSDDDKASYSGFDYSGKTTLAISGVVKVGEGQKPQNWTPKSTVGLFAFKSGQDAENQSLYNDRYNIKYTTLSKGVSAEFLSAYEAEAIQLKKGKLNITAYFPYKAAIDNFIYPLDLKLDKSVFYSSNAKNIQAKEAVNLEFFQVLSQLTVKVQAGENISTLVGMKSTPLKGLANKGRLDLRTGEVLVEDAQIGDIATTLVAGAQESSVSAILLPGQALNKASLVLSLEGKEYTWSISEDITIESNKTYTYTMTIHADGSWVVSPSGEINDWNEGNADGDITVIQPDGSDETVKPGGEIGDWEEGEGDTSIITPEDPIAEVPIGQEVTIMNETFGENGTDRWDLKNETFGNYGGFDTKGVLFSNEGTRLSARAINTVRDKENKYEKHLWFPRFDDNLDGKKPSTPTFAVRNINTANLKDITITYSILGDMRTTMKEYINTNFVKVLVDGRKLKVPSVDLFSTEYSDKFYTITLKVDESFSELIFKTDMSNYTGIRLDNVIIKGIRAK